MKLEAVVHDAEEGGYWAEVPAIPGCAAQGDTMDELLAHLRDAVTTCLSLRPRL
jgi:predicted RNase H-like HicB family nuclease